MSWQRLTIAIPCHSRGTILGAPGDAIPGRNSPGLVDKPGMKSTRSPGLYPAHRCRQCCNPETFRLVPLPHRNLFNQLVRGARNDAGILRSSTLAVFKAPKNTWRRLGFCSHFAPPFSRLIGEIGPAEVVRPAE